MKIISLIRSLLGTSRRESVEGRAMEWARDPLSHPALETMSQRELGDLPFRRGHPGLRDCEPASGMCR